MNKFKAIDLVIWITGLALISVFCQYFGMDWGWTIGSIIAFSITALAATPDEDVEKDVPELNWTCMKNDTSGESPFIVMPKTDPRTQFDGHSTFITQAGYNAMLKGIGKSNVGGSAGGEGDRESGR